MVTVKERPWLQHYPDEISHTLKYDEIPLYDFLVQTAEKHPEKVALHFLGKEVTFKELLYKAKQMAQFLKEKGLRKGDRVASMLPNCPQAVITYYGALLAGGIVVQVNPLFTERELHYQMEDSGAKYIVCLDILYPRVEAVRQKTDLEHIIVTGIKDYLPFPKNLLYPFVQRREYGVIEKAVESADTHYWKSVQAIDPSSFTVADDVDPKNDLALIQYTGGTTGKPKGVMLTHFNLVVNVQMCDAWMYKLKESEEVILGVLPFFHVYGMTTVMNLGIMYGAKTVLLPKFDAGEVLKTIEKLKPTLFPGAPTIYIGLLSHPKLKEYDLSSIEACISGSAGLPLEVQQRFEAETGGRLVEGYGLTETSPVTHANFIWDMRINGSIGVPWPDTDAKVVDSETMEEMPIGEVGEIAVKGPQIMKGYWNMEEETEEVLKEDGWLLTGDMGRMDDQGYFYVEDRKSDMIIAGGYNIYPREIEEVLYEYEGVQEVAVIGVPDEYRGETVKAYIITRDGKPLDEQQLHTYCRKHLAAYKIPRIYEFRDELPKTIVGKVIKRQLVEESIAALEKEEKAN